MKATKVTKAKAKRVTDDYDEYESPDYESPDNEEYHSSSNGKNKSRKSKESQATSSRIRLYAIARGKGGLRPWVFIVNPGTASSSSSVVIRRDVLRR